MATEIAHKMFDALEARDLKTFRTFFTDDAVLWNNTGLVEITLNKAVSKLDMMLAVFKDIRIEQRDFIAIPGGIIAQYLQTGMSVTGKPMVLHAMLRFYIVDGRIKRLEEYIDSKETAVILEAGKLAPQSRMLALGTPAPAFRLPDVVTGKSVALEDFADRRALLVAFISNHCPYVKHLVNGFVTFAHEYGPRGLGVVVISSNDTTSNPEDAPEHMAELAKTRGFAFPYLYDESQSVAKAYQAACTPDFFLFDRDRKLVYRGQFDESRPGARAPVTGADLRAAADAVLGGAPVSVNQTASIGCSIKWKRGQEPQWA
jgi:peroxiredoxin/ketosteroid isomerase-like protein